MIERNNCQLYDVDEAYYEADMRETEKFHRMMVTTVAVCLALMLGFCLAMITWQSHGGVEANIVMDDGVTPAWSDIIFSDALKASGENLTGLYINKTTGQISAPFGHGGDRNLVRKLISEQQDNGSWMIYYIG